VSQCCSAGLTAGDTSAQSVQQLQHATARRCLRVGAALLGLMHGMQRARLAPPAAVAHHRQVLFPHCRCTCWAVVNSIAWLQLQLHACCRQYTRQHNAGAALCTH
jgi:hypothetical protein